MIKKFIQFFSKSCPSGYQIFFQMISRWRKVFIKMEWLLTMITNPFKIPIIQHLETFSFFAFFLSFIQNKTSSYFEKETEWETIFLYFFSRNWRHIFCFDKGKNFQTLMTSWKFINTKTKKLLFSIFSFLIEKSTTRVSALLSTCKKKY